MLRDRTFWALLLLSIAAPMLALGPGLYCLAGPLGFLVIVIPARNALWPGRS